MSRYFINATFRPIVDWPGERTPPAKQVKSQFSATIGATQKELQAELAHLGAKNVIIQLGCDPSQIKNDGFPRSDARATPGVIVTFDLPDGTTLSYPCDTFKNWDCNLRAIALSLKALRTVDRYGVTKKNEQYQGFRLPPAGGTTTSMTVQAAAAVLVRMGGGDAADVIKHAQVAREIYRLAVRAAHPDAGGSTTDFQTLQAAKAVLDRHHGGQS